MTWKVSENKNAAKMKQVWKVSGKVPEFLESVWKGSGDSGKCLKGLEMLESV